MITDSAQYARQSRKLRTSTWIRPTVRGRPTPDFPLQRPRAHSRLFLSWIVALVFVTSPGAYTSFCQSTTSGNIFVVTQALAISGGGDRIPNATGIPAINADLNAPYSVASDSTGHVYIADSGNNLVEMATLSTSEIVVIGGGGDVSPTTVGELALSVRLNSPSGLAVDRAGNLYVSDRSNNLVEKITGASTVNPQIIVVAGGGNTVPGTTAQMATDSKLTSPRGLALDARGNLYIADTGNNLVERLDTSTGTITAVAGGGTTVPSSNPAIAIGASLNQPSGVAVDESGKVYIADTGNQLVERLDASSGTMEVLAGGGSAVPTDSPISGTNALLKQPAGIAAGEADLLYIADTGNGVIEQLDASSGNIVVLAGGGSTTPNDVPGPAASALLSQPTGVNVDEFNNLYVASAGNGLIVKVSTNTTVPDVAEGASSSPVNLQIGLSNATAISKIAISGGLNGRSDFTLSAVSGCIADGVRVNPAGSVCTLSITFSPIYPGERTGRVSVLEGSYVIGTAAIEGKGLGPELVQLPGPIAVVAGGGTAAPGTAPITATNAKLHLPTVVALGASGNLYLADQYRNEVEEVNASTGELRVVAGGGFSIPSNTPIPATSAQLINPSGVALDPAGNIYIADQGNNQLEKVDASTRSIVVIAGGGGGTPGMNPVGAQSVYIVPGDVVADGRGNLYVSDVGNDLVERVVGSSTSNPQIEVIAGGGVLAPATTANVATDVSIVPFGLALDGDDTLYVADSSAGLVEKVQLTSSEIVVVAGGGTVKPSVTPAQSTSVAMNQPFGVALDGASNLYIADTVNDLVEKVDASTGMLSVIAGGGKASSGTAPVNATSASLADPFGIAVDAAGNLYIADYNNDVIEKVGTSAAPLNFPSVNVGAISSSELLRLANIGNRPVYISGVSDPPDFQLQPATSCTLSNSIGEMLVPGSSCGLVYAFVPTKAGQSSETVTIADNTLNNATAQQSFLLTGIANQQIPTVTMLMTSTATESYGGNLTLTAKVTAEGSAVTTGSITFLNGGVPVGSKPVDGMGEASVEISGIDVGSVHLTASYTGTGVYAISTSVPVTVTVTGTLTVAADNASKIYGTANPTFTGNMQGPVAGNSITETFTSSATTMSSVGQYRIIPFASGSNLTDYTVTVVDGTLTIEKAATLTTLSLSSKSIEVNQGVKLTADVTSSTKGTPSGSVTFKNGSDIIGKIEVDPYGMATLVTGGLMSGTSTLTATYSGDQNFTSSASVGENIAVVAPLTPTYSIAARPPHLIVQAGLVGSTLVTITPANGFKGTIAVSCSDLSTDTKCGFAQNGVPTSAVLLSGNNQPTQVEMTVQTSISGEHSLRRRNQRNPQRLALAFLCPAWLMGLRGIYGRRRRPLVRTARRGFTAFLLMSIAVVFSGAFVGCGQGTTPRPDPAPLSQSTVDVKVVAVPVSGDLGSAQTLNITVTIVGLVSSARGGAAVANSRTDLAPGKRLS